MLLDTFSQLGFHTTLLSDGTATVSQADVLLLVGNCLHFTRIAQLLSSIGNSRPKTILWLLEPLAPPGMTQHAQRIGLALAKCDRKNLPPFLLALLRATIPRHRKLQYAAREVLTLLFNREMKRQGWQFSSELCAEALHLPVLQHLWLKQHFPATWCDIVFASTVPRCRLLTSTGINAKYLPLGYDVRWGRPLSMVRDIDVLFLGTLRNRKRLAAVRKLKKRLTSDGLKLTIADNGFYGEKRTRLLNSTKIVLDLVRVPWEMPTMRLLMSMGCGAMVVTNWTGEPTPFSSRHLVRAKTEDIPQTVAYYLAHENERQAIAQAAYNYLTERLTMRNSILKMLKESGLRPAISKSNLKERAYDSYTPPVLG